MYMKSVKQINTFHQSNTFFPKILALLIYACNTFAAQLTLFQQIGTLEQVLKTLTNLNKHECLMSLTNLNKHESEQTLTNLNKQVLKCLNA